MSVDELGEVGLSQLGEEAIDQFLESQRIGVLALPTGETPYVVPMSYGYDGESAVYFTYVLGAESQKERYSEQADRARFLIYSAESPFHWRSVILEGSLEFVPREEWGDAPLDDAWRPDILERADLSGGVAVYRLRIQNRSGLGHAGLPSGFER